MVRVNLGANLALQQVALDANDGATRVMAFNHGYPRQTLMDPAEVPLIREDIKAEAERVSEGKVLALELPTPTGKASQLPGE